MKRITLGLMAALLLTGSAMAQTTHYNNLSFTQAQNLLSGYHVTFHGTYKETNGTDPRDGGTAPVFGDFLVQTSPAQDGNERSYSSEPVDGCWTTTMNGKTILATNVNADCVAYSLSPSKGGTAAGFATVTQQTGTTDLPDVLVDVCIRNDVTDIDFDFHGFDITINTSTSDGSC